MTLAISHMKSEDEGAPIFFWAKLNLKYAKHGVKEVKFVRFMVDGQECISNFYFEENL
jgi:hypothetical protein